MRQLRRGLCTISLIAGSIAFVRAQDIRTGAPIYAAPMTYSIDGRQYVVMPSGTTLIAFALLPRNATQQGRF